MSHALAQVDIEKLCNSDGQKWRLIAFMIGRVSGSRASIESRKQRIGIVAGVLSEIFEWPMEASTRFVKVAFEDADKGDCRIELEAGSQSMRERARGRDRSSQIGACGGIRDTAIQALEIIGRFSCNTPQNLSVKTRLKLLNCMAYPKLIRPWLRQLTCSNPIRYTARPTANHAIVRMLINSNPKSDLLRTAHTSDDKKSKSNATIAIHENQIGGSNSITGPNLDAAQ